MDSELDRTYDPFERNEEFERYLDEIYEKQKLDDFVSKISGGMFTGIEDMADQLWGKK